MRLFYRSDGLSVTREKSPIRKESDYQAMAATGVLATPALTIDGVLKVAGRIPKAEEVQRWLVGA